MDQILQTRHQGVLRLTLNRAEKRNAINPPMYEALIAQLHEAQSNPEVQVVLLCAEGDYFSAGNDRNGFQTVSKMKHADRPGFRFMNAAATFTKPLVAAVNGDAIGIAVTLLLHCDLVYAASGIELKLPFIDIALQPEFASTFLLPRILGHARAAEILMLGRPITAQTATEFGIVNQVFAKADLLSSALAVCEELASKPESALITLKRQMKKHYQQTVVETIESETIEINACLQRLFADS